jgi:hypothetical protein
MPRDSTNYRKLAEHNLSLPWASYHAQADDKTRKLVRTIISSLVIGSIISSIGVGIIISSIVIGISIVSTSIGSTINPADVPTVGSIIVLCIIWLSLSGLRQVTQPC